MCFGDISRGIREQRLNAEQERRPRTFGIAGSVVRSKRSTRRRGVRESIVIRDNRIRGRGGYEKKTQGQVFHNRRRGRQTQEENSETLKRTSDNTVSRDADPATLLVWHMESIGHFPGRSSLQYFTTIACVRFNERSRRHTSTFVPNLVRSSSPCSRRRPVD